jgi:lysophospholipid hydrolase
MKDMGADVIFAVDVGSVNDSTPQRYGDSLSGIRNAEKRLIVGIWGLFNHYNPFSKIPDVPTLSDIQSRLAYATSVAALEKAKSSPGVLYMQPPIQQYATLDFGKFDEIYEVGYQYCKEFLNGLRKEGRLESLVSGGNKDKRRGGPRLGRRQSI